AAGMAHEIGNPITAIMGIQDLLISGDVPADEQAEYLARMRKETERIHQILRDLLDFARPEAAASAAASGSISASPEESGAIGSVVLSEAVTDVLSLLRPQKVFRDIEVAVDVADVEVQIAKDRLEQVLLNLALNACDAMAGAKTKKLSLRAAREGSSVRIEIEDTGPGVAAEVRERLFLPFVTTKEVGLGTGLGLAVCRGIVEGAGGRIELDSSYTRGARFVVVLPGQVD
ncbi:MAG TPA: HAMP domain-containing sensor histidine kinase, partial [Polyangiaceae bacterium]|nr:HAMP domain-containing sensor histidine kinase [Polyangiaceae bacterium]